MPQVGPVPREKRHKAIREMQAMVSGGASDQQAKTHAMQEYGVSAVTARAWLSRCYEDWRRQAEARSNRTHLVSKAVARRELVMRKALEKKDFALFLQACESESKLLGLHAPERHEVVVAHVDVALQAMVAVIAEEVRDPRLLRRISEKVQGVLEAASRVRDVTPSTLRQLSSKLEVETPALPLPPTGGDHWAGVKPVVPPVDGSNGGPP